MNSKIKNAPKWELYTLIKYKGDEEISREQIWIDESRIFASEKDSFLESEDKEVMKPAA